MLLPPEGSVPSHCDTCVFILPLRFGETACTSATASVSVWQRRSVHPRLTRHPWVPVRASSMSCVSPTGVVHARRNVRRLPEEEGFQRDSSQDELLAGAPGPRQRQGRTRIHSQPGLQAAAGRAAGTGLPVPQAGPG